MLRKYDNKTETHVKEHYINMRTYQTLDYVLKMKEKYTKLDKAEMTVWEAFNFLKDFIDKSDPDVDDANLYHAFQTAEGMRKAGEPYYMQVTGLIHDLGKVLYFFGEEKDGQSINEHWGISGDTFVVGAELPKGIVFPEFNSLNLDRTKYNTKIGIYEEGCGMDNLHIAFGHDEYLYMVLKKNQNCKLPDNALKVIRFHSLYPWHSMGEYKHFMNKQDEETLKNVQRFQKYDLYTKHDKKPDLDALWDYYNDLIEWYIPGKLKW